MKILMVCLGNICRSPLAEGILKEKLRKKGITAEVDSAGTDSYHIGEQPDRRSQEIAYKYGIDISNQRARQFTKKDIEYFDKIYVMDRHNFDDVMNRVTNPDDRKKVEMIMKVIDGSGITDVPDPYNGSRDGFQNVYDLLDNACEVIAEQIKMQ